ncbi:hypothetical protein M8J76_005046 [Diaphorina citri]|nr:hypothetical protein M8J76_005046 [Diaphorina citri]
MLRKKRKLTTEVIYVSKEAEITKEVSKIMKKKKKKKKKMKKKNKKKHEITHTEPPASRRSVCRCASDIVAPGHRIPETEDQTQPDLPTRGPEEPWSCRDLFAPATLPLFYGGRGGEV